jgi:TRAP-type C4-dicarboxylate transport system permease small subunit
MSWNFGYLYMVVPVSGVLMEMFALQQLIAVLRGAPLPAVIGHVDMGSAPPSGERELPRRKE